MRVPPVSDLPKSEILDRITRRRGSHGLLPLDLMLLHSPAAADGWHSFFGALNTTSSLADNVRKLAICRVAFLNKAWYQWEGHKSALTDEHARLLQSTKLSERGSLREEQWAALQYADAMTENVAVADELFQELQRVGFDKRQIVELTLVIAAYNCVSRFVVALDVGAGEKSTGLASGEDSRTG